MYDIIIIGGGHAGVEAALACARLNNKTLLISGNFKMIATMACNPSMGGPAKGVVVREIDALGGEMGRAIDKELIQIKMLNMSKGPAVRALRAQVDKVQYPKYMQNLILEQEHLDFKEAYVEKLITESKKVKGVMLENGELIYSKIVIIATGVYMSSKILVGHTYRKEGPDQQRTSSGLSNSLRELGFQTIRLKTGTPPRIKKDTINFENLQIQPGDNEFWKFSEETKDNDVIKYENQQPCYLTYTTSETKEIIMKNLNKSSMYSGLVEGVGPRYCPSIEDKVVRFNTKDRHQVFLEPESLYIDEIYIQGLSTSFPNDIQDRLVKSLPGLENAVIAKYAYAIEYDAIDPTQLNASLESKDIENLFFAGQVNGTSGYEEAACQGLIAAINASNKINNKNPLILRRDEAYIGVLIDDLITKGIKDPYRLLTSRAEFRLLLRHDNSEERLIEYGYNSGLISKERYDRYLKKKNDINNLIELIDKVYITAKPEINEYLTKNNKSVINVKISGKEFLRRPDSNFADLVNILGLNLEYSKDVFEKALIQIKYAGYIEKEYKEASKLKSLQSKIIPRKINYDNIVNLASEAREKLKKVRPENISQATRISGVNPSDISILLIYLEGNKFE
ncbi:MAG: tRNA uridine-5-carboxymethylaminomethyl(34) synthesis enzyme MnmG [Bacilli bacterium]|nr:tRNA uridine-5-carboxymethylaminomethyl(34) synthesis enzyme MnmG [Bacilli bacterium]MDD2681613.1 tRNA uridine-5-carboxymethylaminomethyl(34) synthesis enzyme MnmG [Bacilli bacterium]MDD3120820.1 tRNA uridine-5-carboxymethylaminomethyl(34) synthesis enzyme MnmG [Bacilli bacterium]MDD4063015.1 tRNA uridine-5-carboxymethylaminomethyl(34) synthesis enzyme MnmG [Bacilli bacterium]MDD4481705.1 tRNA uridine-5-carboxymethylaminomethyl(34) synthesis enzyme MnmG [Bacilli bacterium]